MGILPWDLGSSFGFSFVEHVRNPRLTVRCEYEDMPPTDVTFGLSPSYGIQTAREAHDWFLDMMREHQEFEVETDGAGVLPLPFWCETVRLECRTTVMAAVKAEDVVTAVKMLERIDKRLAPPRHRMVSSTVARSESPPAI